MSSLLAFILIWTNLADHLDMDFDFDGLRAADKTLGNREGWGDFEAKSLDQGVATHVYAAFDPDLKGMVFIHGLSH